MCLAGTGLHFKFIRILSRKYFLKKFHTFSALSTSYYTLCHYFLEGKHAAVLNVSRDVVKLLQTSQENQWQPLTFIHKYASAILQYYSDSAS